MNANSKGPGETAHLRKCADSSELLLLAHAIKANVDCVSMCKECELQEASNRALARLLVQLWFYLFGMASLMLEHYAREYGCLKTTAKVVSLSMQLEKALARLRKMHVQ